MAAPSVNVAALRDRWEENHHWFREEHLNYGAHSPFGKFNEREDFRGLTILPLPNRRMHLRGRAIKDTDFSYSNLVEAWWEDTSFCNCVFDAVDLSSMRQWRVKFDQCSFQKTKFVSASFGADGATYNKCLFEKARFLGAIIHEPEFLDCKFIDCNLRGLDFHAARFVRTKFSGKLTDVQFHGTLPCNDFTNPMYEVDFSDAIFSDVGFWNHCDLSTVKIPTDGCHLLVPNLNKTLDCVRKKLDKISDTALLTGTAIWVPLLQQFAIDEEYYIVSAHDLKHDGDAFAHHFMELLCQCNE